MGAEEGRVSALLAGGLGERLLGRLLELREQRDLVLGQLAMVENVRVSAMQLESLTTQR
jgi:hypothetical protein